MKNIILKKIVHVGFVQKKAGDGCIFHSFNLSKLSQVKSGSPRRSREDNKDPLMRSCCAQYRVLFFIFVLLCLFILTTIFTMSSSRHNKKYTDSIHIRVLFYSRLRDKQPHLCHSDNYTVTGGILLYRLRFLPYEQRTHKRYAATISRASIVRTRLHMQGRSMGGARDRDELSSGGEDSESIAFSLPARVSQRAGRGVSGHPAQPSLTRPLPPSWRCRSLCETTGRVESDGM